MTLSATTYMTRGFDLLYTEQDYDAAIAQFRIAVEFLKHGKSKKETKKMDTRLAHVYDLLGCALFHKGQYKTALSEFQNASSYRSQPVSSSFGWIGCFLTNKPREQSLLDEGWAYYRMGKCYQAEGDFVMASKYWEEAVLIQRQALMKTKEKQQSEGIFWLRSRLSVVQRTRMAPEVNEMDEDRSNQTDKNMEIPETIYVSSSDSSVYAWTTIGKGVISDGKQVTLLEETDKGEEIELRSVDM